MLSLPKKVFIREVGTRDGFQMEKTFIPTDTKVAIADRLSRCNFQEIQATAFVSPKAIPNLADAELFLQRIARNPATRYTTLIPNATGYQRAAAAGISRVEMTISATDSHNRNNLKSTTAESIARLESCVAMGLDVEIVAGIAVAFACPFEGRTPYAAVQRIVDAAVAMGLGEVALGDTTGGADPTQVYDYCRRLRRRHPNLDILVHFHNTFGTATANVLAAVQAGITRFDASVAGLGGCPYAPGATGNLATEDLVHFMEGMGIDTGIDLDRLIDAARFTAAAIGHSDSCLLRAGRRMKDVCAVDGR
ncbi:MAG: hydroxymethylglutaryl-CoA lyase [Planctomycetes bacterium]|nr:hydroxymethylglutaryl-CoA lyase [Planctomycetota bacterium]